MLEVRESPVIEMVEEFMQIGPKSFQLGDTESKGPFVEMNKS